MATAFLHMFVNGVQSVVSAVLCYKTGQLHCFFPLGCLALFSNPLEPYLSVTTSHTNNHQRSRQINLEDIVAKAMIGRPILGLA